MCCPCVPFFLKSGPDLAQILAPNAALSSTPAQILAPNAALSSTLALILALILAPILALISTPAQNAGPLSSTPAAPSFQLRRLKLNSFFSPFSL